MAKYYGAFKQDQPDTLSDYEFCLTDSERNVRVYVSAVGGGTLGKSYALNYWHYLVMPQRGEETEKVLLVGSDFYSGFHRNHQEVAEAIIEYLLDTVTE